MATRKKRGNPSYGTSYFVSKSAAVRYYAAYEDDPKSAVELKLREGSIHIGKPPLKPGQRLSTTDGGKRYMIVEDNATRVRGRGRNPIPGFKRLFVVCDEKKFGPYRTMTKAKSMALKVARVLDKPAKIMGEARKTAAAATNPRRSPRSRKVRKLRKSRRNPQKVQFVVEWGSSTNFFDTLKQAKKFKGQLYSRGLLFGRHVRIVRMTPGERSKVVFEKTY